MAKSYMPKNLFGGTLQNTNLQFYVRKTDKDLLEIRTAFNLVNSAGLILNRYGQTINKIQLGFRKFDTKAEKGERLTAQIDFFMDIPEFELFCQNILSGNLIARVNRKETPTYYKGSVRNGEVLSRVLRVARSNKGVFLNATEGPGHKSESGAVQPDYNMGEAPSKVSIALNSEELKEFALQGRRALDFYYANCFGRN